MLKRLFRHAVVAGALVATLGVAGPVNGWVETARTGTTGPHSLTDTKANPGAICVYKPYPGWELSRFKHIYVNAPKIKAVAGQANQKVAWSFTVQRREWNIWTPDPGPWENTYTSPKWNASTNATTNAAFTQKGVKVNVPTDPGLDASYQYRVEVKTFWYRPNGNVQGTATMRIERYAQQHETETNGAKSCWDYV